MLQKTKLQVALCVCVLFVSTQIQAQNKTPVDVFAKVANDVISMDEFNARLRIGMRQRFFHSKVPNDDEMINFKKDIGQQLIDNTILLQEAKRRKITVNKTIIDQKMDALEQKRKNDPYWQKNRERLVAGIRKEMENENSLQQLKESIKMQKDPDEKDIKDYFDRNPEKFTIPERLRVSLILLKVDPSSTSSIWSLAMEEAAGLVNKIRSGQDFKELARIHSGDESAKDGGDMGFIHKGMLAKPAQQILDLMQIGEISEPIVLLQGVAIFRLEERTVPKLNTLEKIKDTVKGLLIRERSELAWSDFMQKIRNETKVEINDLAYTLSKK